ncbi:MAG TPA: oxidoreductase [Candidatus Angelobacter sp.]
MKNALVVGSSGLVGRFCLQALLGDPAYNSVVSIARRELQVHDPKLVQKVMPFESLASLQLPPIDDVFCALGTTIRKAGSQAAFRRVDYEYPLTVADRALRFGAKQFMLVSSVGADSKSKNFYLRTKGELEQALRRLPFRTAHIFRPSFLMGPREESRFGESVAIPLAKIFQFLLVGGLRRYRAIAAQTVGRAMVAAAKADREGAFIWEFDEITRLAHSL